MAFPENISIVQLAPPQVATGGDFIYRLLQPDAALAAVPGFTTVSAVNLVRERLELALGADLLVLQLLGDPDLLPIMFERKRKGLATVFEISDNFLSFQPSNPAAAFYNDPENRACILQLISQCDAVQVTVPALAEIFCRYNPRTVVFENRMASLGKPERPEGPIVVGWGGSVGHLEDIRRIAPALVAWARKTPGVKLAVMGDAAFKELFAELPPALFEYTPPGGLDDFYNFIQTIHIGIAPIRDDPFNLCRSDVKFMEYASRGAAPVCSNAPTYGRNVRDGETGLLFSNTDELISRLDSLVSAPELRARIAKNAYEYIKTERMESDGARIRAEFYTELLREKKGGGRLSGNRLEEIKTLKKTPGVSHYLHVPSDIEELVYSGLVYQFNRGEFAEAERCFREAAAAAPDYFQAHFYLGNLLMREDTREAEKYFRRALEIWPESCETALRIARLRFAVGRKKEARGMVEKIMTARPEYAPACNFKAEMLEMEGDRLGAETALEAAVAANQYHIPSLVALGVSSLESSEYEKAVEYFREASGASPDHAEARYGLGMALKAVGAKEEAGAELLAAMQTGRDCADHSARAYLEIALEHYKKGDVAKAGKMISSALEVAPEQPDLLFWMLRISAKSGDKEAEAAYGERLRLADTQGRFKRYYQT